MNGTDFGIFFKRFAKRFLTTRGAILLALAGTVLLSIISYRSVVKLNSLGGLVNRTHTVQLNLHRTYSALSDADSQLKAFLITKDSNYYSKLMREESLIREFIGRLRILTLDNISQHKRISSLDSLIRARWAYMEASMAGEEEHYDFFSTRIDECNKLLASAIQSLNVEEEKFLQAQSENASRYQTIAPRYLLAIQLLIVSFLVIGFILVRADIKTKERLQRETAQKNNELKKQRDFVQGIFDNTVDVIFIFDPELNILALNRRARELYDPTGNAKGKNVLDLFPQARGSKFIEHTQEALNGQHVHSGAKESTVHPGVFYESFFVPLYSADGTISGAMAIHHDVSDIMRMTSEVQSINEELKKSNHELEQFAYVASHDLQEPLRKISTFADIAMRNIESREAVTSNLEKVSSSAKRMSTLIKDILDYSRVSNSSAKFKEVDLNQVLDQVLHDFELTIKEKDATIESGSLPKVLGSHQQLTQVFGNIISNALKFCTSAPCVKITCEHSNDEYAISFSDNGVGFDQAFADQIFMVFHRLNQRSEFPGTGIGLALCKRIMENHGGSIKATSIPQRGTTMTITIPELEKTRLLSGNIQTLQNSVRDSLGSGFLSFSKSAANKPGSGFSKNSK